MRRAPLKVNKKIDGVCMLHYFPKPICFIYLSPISHCYLLINVWKLNLKRHPFTRVQYKIGVANSKENKEREKSNMNL